MNSHPPEVLAALVVRLRSEVGRAEYQWRRQVPELSVDVHVLERDDVEAAVNAGVLQIDRVATLILAREAHGEDPGAMVAAAFEVLRR